MSTKRRRTSSDEEESEGSSSTEPSPSVTPAIRKRKKLDPMELCQQLYDSIRTFKKEDGTMLCDTFIRAPKRRQEPSYYEVVANPIDLLRVQQKLKTDSYEDIEELTADFELLVSNAKAFYKPDSSEYQDACSLWDIFKTNKMKLLETVHEDSAALQAAGIPVEVKTRNTPGRIGRPKKVLDDDQMSENSSENNDFDPYEELFSSVMTATEDNRSLHIMFQLLPSKKLYPEYYEVIDHPIDLKFIANKIQTNAYTNLNEMEKDLLQMTKNACTFNEPGSQIYKDAKTLKKIFQQRKIELESGKYRRSGRRRTGQSLSSVCAALKEDPESSDEEIDEEMDGDQSGPLWQLFDYLYNQASIADGTNLGTPLGESLWKLPNRRFNTEYYSSIKKPISMAQIQKKLKKGEYTNITDMTADLYLMLDNAKKAFPATHKTHKDAVKMQKILNQKLVDTGVDMESSDTEDTDSSSMQQAPMTTPPPAPAIPEKRKKGRPRIHNIPSTSPASTNTPTSTPSSSKSYRFPNNPLMKKKLLSLQKYLVEYVIDARTPMALFMEKPSKKLYPDYYQVIQHPIDMNTIELNIKNDRYGTVDDVVGDYRLMFSNCRKYNEENSMIFNDANLMERVLNDKLKELSGVTDRRPKLLKPGRKTVTALDAKLKQLYEAIRDYKEPKLGRQLSLIFMKLPSKNEYPDYYEIIKQPIDMERIAIKLKQQQYDAIDELSTDLMLMFENACKYNEPDSQIYKDALVLQQICIQTKLNLRTDDETVPDVPQVVQEMLLSLFTTIYNYQDEEGRCYSDSLAELPEIEEADGKKVRAISLDLIKRRLDKGLYKRLDTFQEDVFSCFDRARKLSPTDSQVFEDSIEMQSYFIKKRDELCKNGEVLSSPALSYSAMHLSAAVEALRQDKLLQEGGEHKEEETEPIATTQGESMTIDQKVYSPGDFVYYELQDDPTPGIMYVERLWTNNEGVKMCYGNVILRPYQTYHLQTRKFMEQEVFKSDSHQACPLTDVVGKCFVMNVKDFFKYKAEGFADKDIYVCESRYTTKVRSFKKIKTWPFQRNEPVKLELREVPLEPKRVQSVFKDRPEPVKTEIPVDEVELVVQEKDRPNLIVTVQGGEEGNTYYEQYNTICSGVVKTGDYVYVATESGKQAISQINSIWETKDGKSFFRGPWLLLPSELPPLPNRMYYRQEVFLSTVQETTPTVAIVGRCCVLEYYEYTTRRPTEIPENDLYLCESIYDELKKQIKKLNTPGGLRKFTHTQAVVPDEIYFFRRSITVQKVTPESSSDLKHSRHASELELKMEANGGGNSNDMLLGMTEDSMDTPSVGSADFANTSSPIPGSSSYHLSTPLMGNKRPPAFSGGRSGKKVVTGYILFSSERRKGKVDQNPDCKFGEISRMIGNDWRALPSSERQMWEDKANRINESNAAKYAEEMALNGDNKITASPGISGSIITPTQLSQQHEFVVNQVFECCWDKCDWQFEDPGDLLEHCVSDGVGCVHKHFANLTANNEASIYHCLWRNCIRLKRNLPPLPNMQRLIKHVRDVHAVKGIGKTIQPNDRSKNYMTSTRKHMNIHLNQQSSQNTQIMNNSYVSQPIMTTPISTGSPQLIYTGSQQPQGIINYVSAPEPLFITVPPRPQRVLHSDAYIKYIEGLQNNSSYISNWDKTLKASKETVPVDYSRLPTQWLNTKTKQKPEEVVDALWKLRNFMWRDALSLNKSLF